MRCCHAVPSLADVKRHSSQFCKAKLSFPTPKRLSGEELAKARSAPACKHCPSSMYLCMPTNGRCLRGAGLQLNVFLPGTTVVTSHLLPTPLPSDAPCEPVETSRHSHDCHAHRSWSPLRGTCRTSMCGTAHGTCKRAPSSLRRTLRCQVCGLRPPQGQEFSAQNALKA
jgi:hypothetical protein